MGNIQSVGERFAALVGEKSIDRKGAVRAVGEHHREEFAGVFGVAAIKKADSDPIFNEAGHQHFCEILKDLVSAVRRGK